MKRIMSVVLAIMIIMSMAVPVFATESARMIFFTDEETANRGDTITVGISLSTVDDCRSGGIVISYDASVFEFVGGKCLVAGTAMSDFSGGTGVFAMAEGSTVTGKVFQFSLKIKDDAPVGSYKVSGSASVRDGNGSIPCGVNAATITISCDHDYDTWTSEENSHYRKCAKCDHVESANHTWGEGTVIQAATCAEEGQEKVACTVCGYEKLAAIPKTDNHQFGTVIDNGDGSHKQVCGLCGKEKASDHTWNEGTVTVKATCIQEGKKEYACTVCGHKKENAIPKSDSHQFGSFTDNGDGKHKQVCELCGKENTSAHTWTEGAMTMKATCSQEGKKEYICTACKAVRTEVIAKNKDHKYQVEVLNDHNHKAVCTACGKENISAHNWNKGKVTKSATCAKKGEKTYTCNDCGLKRTEAIAKTETHTFVNDCDTNCNICGMVRSIQHQYQDNLTMDEENHWKICTVCGATDAVQPHDFGEVCGSPCATCGYERAGGHNFGNQWVHDESGHWQVCADCGEETEVSAHIPGEEATEFTSQSCIVCGFELVPALGHQFGQEWLHDAENHWHECACGEQDSMSAHNWDEGRKDEDHTITFSCTECGEARVETIPQESFLWWILLVGVGALTTIGVMVARKRKR